MKKVLIFILLAVMALPVIPARASSAPVPCEEEISAMVSPNLCVAVSPVSTPCKEELTATVTVYVYLGRKKKNCTGFGICDVSVEWGFNPAPNNDPRVAVGTASIENGRLQIAFNRSTIASSTLQTYFGENTVKIEEDFILPGEVVAALGIDSYTIKTGTYTIGQSADTNILPVSF